MQGRHLTSGLGPYIAGAAVVAFALDFCAPGETVADVLIIAEHARVSDG
jgi:hypothetical protein